MKKWICALACVCMILSFGGCDMDTYTEGPQKSGVSVSTAEKVTTTETVPTITEKNTTAPTVKTTAKITTAKKTTTEQPVVTTMRVTTTREKVTTKRTTQKEVHSRTVYKTPTGKRYHFDPDCGGKNSKATTLDVAESLGLTPCKKCAQ